MERVMRKVAQDFRSETIRLAPISGQSITQVADDLEFGKSTRFTYINMAQPRS